MAFDEAVAGRVRKALAGTPDVVEKRMFGGIAFMVRGNMCCGVIGDRLMLRVGPKGYETALSRPHARADGFHGEADERDGLRRARGVRLAPGPQGVDRKGDGVHALAPRQVAPAGRLVSTTRARGRGRGEGR